MATKTHIMSDETGQQIVALLEIMARDKMIHYDASSGEYLGIGTYFESMREGKKITVAIPKGSATACIKMDDNAGMATPVLGSNIAAAIDNYVNIFAFYHQEVNGFVDANGVPHVKAINGDGRYMRKGNGSVFIMTPVLFVRVWDDDDYTYISICDTQLPGYSPQPGALLPDGTVRPFMLYAKYPMSLVDGEPVSMSGQQPLTRTVSQNGLVSICDTANSGYSGLTKADMWYITTMFLMKYATKNSQGVFYGCANYSNVNPITQATDNQASFVVAEGHGFVEGSAVMIGTENTDRGNAAAHDVLDYGVITGIESLGDGNDRISLDHPATTAVGNYVSTAPWPTGCCDGVQGDGSPTNPKSGKEPFVLQGIELMHGMYEVMSGVGLRYEDSLCKVMVLDDTKYEGTTIDDHYVDTGVRLTNGEAEGWNYPTYLVYAGGMPVGVGTGASTSTGLCDGQYLNNKATVGDREFLAFGNLGSGSGAGLWCVVGTSTGRARGGASAPAFLSLVAQRG